MEEFRRLIPVFVVIVCTLALMHLCVRQKLLELEWVRRRPAAGQLVRWSVMFASGWMVLAVPLLVSHDFTWLPAAATAWLLAVTLFWVLLVVASAAWLKWAHAAVFDPARRRMLALAVPVAAAPLGGAGFGLALARYGLSVVETRIVIPGLHRDLDGLRIAQLSDIHYGPFFGRDELARAIAMANETRPHLTVLTGDLITRMGDDLDGCLELLRGLRAEAGIFGCHGNHERYARALDYATRRGARLGFSFLRGQSSLLRFGQAGLNLAGSDYVGTGSTRIPGAEALLVPGCVNILLQHNPAAFPAAARLGYHLMLAGHTHGGQVNLPLLGENLNVARPFTPYVRGRYELGASHLYVSCGLGTVGIPVRVGAPPEVILVKLCAT